MSVGKQDIISSSLEHFGTTIGDSTRVNQYNRV